MHLYVLHEHNTRDNISIIISDNTHVCFVTLSEKGNGSTKQSDVQMTTGHLGC